MGNEGSSSVGGDPVAKAVPESRSLEEGRQSSAPEEGHCG